MRKLAILILASLFLLPLTASYAKMGGNPRFVWDANTESDLAGYKIYYIEAVKGWTDPALRVADVGNVTEFYIRDLANIPENVEMMFGLTAYDDVGNESLKGFDQPKETFDFTGPEPPIGCKIVP